MFRVENDYFLYCFAIIPIVSILFILLMNWRKKVRRKIGDLHLIDRLTPFYSKGTLILKHILVTITFIFIVIALANPQIGSKLETVKREGVDLIIALDVSKSMLAEDVQPNRIERGKLLVSKLIDELKGDRVGIIVYAGQAYTQLPLTTDYAAAKMFLKTINTNIVPSQGTAIGEAIKMARTSFNSTNKKHQTLVVISDGENHEEGAIEAVNDITSDGFTIYTIGVGLEKGGPIPIARKGKATEFKKDRSGNVVITKLDPTMLQKIAVAGGGNYISGDRIHDAVEFISDKLAGMEKVEIEAKLYTDYEDQFQWFLGIALFFIILEYLIPNQRSVLFQKLKRSK